MSDVADNHCSDSKMSLKKEIDSADNRADVSPVVSSYTASNTKHNEPGGLFGYISRKKMQQQAINSPAANSTNPNHAKSRMKYHKLANIGASNYLLDISDSEDDEPVVPRDSAMSPPPIFDTPSIEADLTSESWFSRFQKSTANEIKQKIDSEESLSWMGQALRTVDDATTKASDWISNQTENSSNWASSLSSYIPSINWSPFAKENNTLPTINEESTEPNNSLASLPRMASRARISFARNPYQAVIGRDTDYLLSSNTAYFWGLNWASNSWLTWIRNKTMKLIEATDETYQKAIERPKSQPSEASIQAVKNLLLLVETESTDFQRLPTNSSDVSSQLSDTPSHNSPLEGFPDINLSPKTTDQLADDDPPAFDQNLSFDSCASSYESQSFPVRSSPVRPEPPYGQNNSDNGVKNNPNSAKNAEMASRLAEGTLRAYRLVISPKFML